MCSGEMFYRTKAEKPESYQLVSLTNTSKDFTGPMGRF